MRHPQPAEPSVDADLRQALARLLAPLARLSVANGLPFAVVEELLKQAFVQAARESQQGAQLRDISRVATATGLTRREVTRLSQTPTAFAPQRPSPATRLFTRWRSDRKLCDQQGQPLVLKRQGPAPSFEALALSITRDVHPRSLLAELDRLGLAAHDASSDTVRLLQDAFVPRDDQSRMYGFLANNVGDHLAAGVANVLGGPRRHFEQAIFADELSEASIDEAKRLVNAQWRGLLAALVPELEALIESDRLADRRESMRRADRRLRIGLYSYDESLPGGDRKES